MSADLKIEEYRSLLESMHSLCNEMPKVIIHNYFDVNKCLYSLYFEAFHSIKGICVLLGNGGLITQTASILRMAIEQTATIRVLEDHKELQDAYKEHRRLRYEVMDLDSSEKRKNVREHFKDKMDDSDIKKTLEYLEYGWLKPLNKEYGFNTLIDLSEIQDDNVIKNWKNKLNHFVHGPLEFTNFASTIDGPIVYAHVLISIAAKLLDILICDFHNENNFSFVIDNIDYRKKFLDAYIAIKDKGDKK